MKLVIVIAAYNEEKTIGRTVDSVLGYGDVVVVSDGSTDNTSLIALSKGATVFDQVNKGYDGALDAGFKQAVLNGATHVITFDADGQHPSDAIPEYIQKFKEGRELIVGVRPNKQRLGESLFAVYTKLFFGIDDPLCGMKGYDLNLYKKIGHFDSYKSTGTELMLRYLKAGRKHSQVPIQIYDRVDSPRFGRALRANIYILHSLYNGIFKI